MENIKTIISSVRNIMRRDRGVSGDAQRLEQLGWLLFLKIYDEKDLENELLNKNYKSLIPKKFQWRNWASDSEGITGDELLYFIDSPNNGLFSTLKKLNENMIKQVFDSSNNYMKSGYEIRKVINKLNEFNFNVSKDREIFGEVYETILSELRDAGNKGEYYTPRPITKLMTEIVKPKVGEKILDPAAGTGGFLTSVLKNLREKYVRSISDEKKLANSLNGWELKPVSFVLGLTNLILNKIDNPNWFYLDTLKKEYKSITYKDQYNIILANPPFGASIAEGVETNFPKAFQCKESADLFIIQIIQLLKKNGRAAIILPDSCITGDGYKERIREKLLKDCEVNTIVRLPNNVFHPATVSTNIVFFKKGTPTKKIWYYEHKLPLNQPTYSKTKPLRYDEFNTMLDWWNKRVENENAWLVDVKNLKKGFDLDMRNPNSNKNLNNSNHSKLNLENLKKSIKINQNLLNEIERLLK